MKINKPFLAGFLVLLFLLFLHFLMRKEGFKKKKSDDFFCEGGFEQVGDFRICASDFAGYP